MTHVRKSLQASYSTNLVNGRFEVLCVDNRTYTRAAKNKDPALVKASGIEALRLFCYNRAAESQRSAAKHFMTTSLPSLLTSAQLWLDYNTRTSSGKTESSSELRQIVNISQSNIEELGIEKKNGKIFPFQDDLVDKSYDVCGKWKDNGKEVGKKWDEWHFKSYKSACLHDGCHKTAVRGSFDWNAELASDMRADLSTLWNTSIGHAVDADDNCVLTEELHEIYGSILKLLDKIKEEANGTRNQIILHKYALADI
jgi:hypothetical protein